MTNLSHIAKRALKAGVQPTPDAVRCNHFTLNEATLAAAIADEEFDTGNILTDLVNLHRAQDSVSALLAAASVAADLERLGWAIPHTIACRMGDILSSKDGAHS